MALEPSTAPLAKGQASLGRLGGEKALAALRPLEADSRALKGAPADAEAQKAALKKACRTFEAYFLQVMWREMRKTVPKGGFLHGGFAEDMMTDRLHQAYSEEAAKGGSMGLADMLERQLSTRLYKKPQSGQQVKPLSAAGQGQASAASGGAQRAPSLTSPVSGRISSLFGSRVHPVTGQEQEHQGLDLAAAAGSPVLAAAAGKVRFAGAKGGYGNTVIIEHQDGAQTLYAHCRDLLVKGGQPVSAGQEIATVGSSGLSTGPHLHFEYRDAQGRTRDPLPMLATTGLAAAA